MKSLQCVLEMLIEASASTPDERAAAREVIAREFGEKQPASQAKPKRVRK